MGVPMAVQPQKMKTLCLMQILMQKISVLDDCRIGKEKFMDFDLAAFAKKTFGMYGGQDEVVTLVCHNRLIGVMLDRFGQGVPLVPVDDSRFYVKPLVAVSQQFYGWLTGLGNVVQLAGPEHVKQEYKEYLEEILKNY